MLLQTRNVPQPSPADPPPGPNDPPPGTHLFTMAQHYFSVPLNSEKPRWWYISEPVEIVCYPHLPDFNVLPLAMEELVLPFHDPFDPPNVPELDTVENNDEGDEEVQLEPEAAPWDIDLAGNAQEVQLVHDGDANIDLAPDAHIALQQLAEHGVRVSPLVAVDFGRAVWLEYKSFHSNELRLRYVNFPSVDVDRSAEGFSGLSNPGDIHTLEVPAEVDLKMVCHIGLDQAQGTVILGMRSSTVHVLRYS